MLKNMSVTNLGCAESWTSIVFDCAFDTAGHSSGGVWTSRVVIIWTRAARKKGSASLSSLTDIAGPGKERRSLPFVDMTALLVGESSKVSNEHCFLILLMIRAAF